MRCVDDRIADKTADCRICSCMSLAEQQFLNTQGKLLPVAVPLLVLVWQKARRRNKRAPLRSVPREMLQDGARLSSWNGVSFRRQ